MSDLGGPFGPPPAPSAGPPPGAPLSDDGRYWWDGTRWNAVPPPAAPPPPPVAQPWTQAAVIAPVPVASPWVQPEATPDPVAQPWSQPTPAGSWGPPGYAGAQTAQQPPPGAAPARSSNARWILIALAAVVVVAASVVAFLVVRGNGSNGLASKSPDQIVQAATTAVKGATGFEMTGSGDFGGGVTSVDFKVHGSDLEGSMTLDGDSVSFDFIGGNVYFNAPPAYWTAQGASSAEISEFAGKWVEIPAGSSSSSDFTGISGITDIAGDLSDHGTLASDGTGTVGGQSVVLVKDTSTGSVVAVATSGTAYPMRLSQSSGAETGTITFSNWDNVSAFTPPPNPISIPSGS